MKQRIETLLSDPRLPGDKLRLSLPLRPFLKWAGGKRRLLTQMSRFFPTSFNTYFEPFLGGGAVFFYLYSVGLVSKTSVLADLNDELINCYRVVSKQPFDLIEQLRQYTISEKSFYRVRAMKPQDLSPVERASRFIFLNKTCFNGLYRVNCTGEFNVPYGRYKNPVICDEQAILQASIALQSAVLMATGFEVTLQTVKPRDFVYLDPPYVPTSSSSSFTGYTSGGFTLADHCRLAEEFRRLDRLGAQVLMSNSDTDFVRCLYRGFELTRVRSSRAINSNPLGRGPVNELLIRNY
ncbi:MAG: DNA adenine methylase [Acidobacteriota bacterium]|nr:DNA adenine methylase [Blastocatellia bacterium]MDW8413800.1 DNA adenine methylase [Acidobacteriota bacterium]